MAHLRITNGYKRLSGCNLQVKMLSILNGVKNNPYFPSPLPGMPAFEAAITAYGETLATDGGRANAAAKEARRKELIILAVRLSNYVLFIADGDYEIAVSSCFDLAKPYGSAPGVSEPRGLKLQDGINAGELLLRFKKVRGAKMYIYQYSLDPEKGEWLSAKGTTTRFLAKSLEHGKRYWFRVVAVGKGGKEAVSSMTASRVTQ